MPSSSPHGQKNSKKRSETFSVVLIPRLPAQISFFKKRNTMTSQTPALPPISAAADEHLWHGYLCVGHHFPPPACVAKSDDLARPGYSQVNCAEFVDSPEVLDAKADVLVSLIRASKSMMIYSGAGISTAAGIKDYASHASESVAVKQNEVKKVSGRSMLPTLSHRVIAALEAAGFVAHWLQQNHDGLGQKAGFPHEKINEIHGSWFDKSNPVVKMSGKLRGDLFEWMLEWEKRADFVLALGTSFSGMNADRCAQACATRHSKKGLGHGLAIVTLQRTPMDGEAGLRVFAKLDDFMGIVAKKMGLKLGRCVNDPTPPAALIKQRLARLEQLKRKTEDDE